MGRRPRSAAGELFSSRGIEFIHERATVPRQAGVGRLPRPLADGEEFGLYLHGLVILGAHPPLHGSEPFTGGSVKPTETGTELQREQHYARINPQSRLS
jgi:hypothetical protein